MNAKVIKQNPIEFEKITNDDIAVPTALNSPDRTNLQDLGARIHVEKNGGFASDSKIMRYAFDDADLDDTKGMLLGDDDVLELDNLEQVEAFRFITNDDGVEVILQVQYFENKTNG